MSSGTGRAGAVDAGSLDPPELAEHEAGETRGEDRLAGGRRAHGCEELLAAGRLHEVAEGARLDRVEDVLVVAARREDEDPRRHLRGGEGRAHLGAGEAREVEVEDEDVRRRGPGAGHRRAPVVRRREDLEPGVGEVAGHGIAPHRVVVRDDDADVLGRRAAPPLRHGVLLLRHDAPRPWVRAPAPLSTRTSSWRPWCRLVRRAARRCGIRSSTVVPPPGPEATVAVPPRSASRPRMLDETPRRPWRDRLVEATGRHAAPGVADRHRHLVAGVVEQDPGAGVVTGVLAHVVEGRLHRGDDLVGHPARQQNRVGGRDELHPLALDVAQQRPQVRVTADGATDLPRGRPG